MSFGKAVDLIRHRDHGELEDEFGGASYRAAQVFGAGGGVSHDRVIHRG